MRNLVENFGIIHIDILKRWAEDVANYAHGTAVLFVDERRNFGTLSLSHAVFPALEQCAKLVVKLSHALILSRGANDDAKIGGLYALDKTAETHFLFGRLDFLRYGNLVVERD